ncbi:MAG: phosphoglycerate mutase, partial [bacterium]
NLTTVTDGVLRDFSGGHISPKDAAELIAALNDQMGSPELRFYTGVSYRNLLIISGDGITAEVKADKPDDNHGERVNDHLPCARTPEGQRTEALLRRIIAAAPAILESHPVNRRRAAAGLPMANGVWPWSGGRAGALRTIESKYGVRGAVITAVDVIAGMGRLLGLDVIQVPGATGYIDTNFEGKASAALAALRTHDFVYLHLEAIDEVSHAQNLALKLQTIEDFDRRIIVPVLEAIGPDVNAVVLPDHPVPLRLGRHTRTPVPVAVRQKGITPDKVISYSERTCPQGSLGALQGDGLMRLLFG